MANQTDKPSTISKIEALGFVWDVCLAVAIPAMGFAYLGRWLDRTYQLSPWCTLLGLVLALALSGAIVSRQAMRFAKRMKTPISPP